MPELLTVGVTQTADKAFQIIELRPVRFAGVNDLQPTGVKFVWTRDTFSAPRGFWEGGVTLRTVRDDYPGSEQPVEQVLGWHHDPFTLEGAWDDRYGGAGFAVQTWQDFEALTKRGNFVRIEFQAISITGLITNFRYRYKRRDYIEYTFTFSPHFRSPKESVKAVVAGSRATLDPRTVAKQARRRLEEVRAAQDLATSSNLSQVQSVLSSDIFREINGFIDQMDVALAKVDAAVNAPIDAVESAANAFSRATQILSSVKSVAAGAITRIQNVAATTELGVQTAATVLDFETWIRTLAARLRELIVGSDDAQRELLPRSEPGIKKLHRARAGESLYAVSNFYYRTPHRWREIMARNGLDKLVLDGGELLVIPE